MPEDQTILYQQAIRSVLIIGAGVIEERQDFWIITYSTGDRRRFSPRLAHQQRRRSRPANWPGDAGRAGQ
jgi:hypothetical protein